MEGVAVKKIISGILAFLAAGNAFALGTKPTGAGVNMTKSTTAPTPTGVDRVWVNTSTDHLYFTDSSNVDHDLFAAITGGYATVQENGVALTHRSTLNFSTAFNCVDSASYSTTNCDLAASTVTASSYGNSGSVATFAVNSQGIITGAASVAIAVGQSAVTGLSSTYPINTTSAPTTGYVLAWNGSAYVPTVSAGGGSYATPTGKATTAASAGSATTAIRSDANIPIDVSSSFSPTWLGAHSFTGSSFSVASTGALNLSSGSSNQLNINNTGGGGVGLGNSTSGPVAISGTYLLIQGGGGGSSSGVIISANANTPLNLTGSAASTWKTTSGSLTIDSAAALTLASSTATSFTLGGATAASATAGSTSYVTGMAGGTSSGSGVNAGMGGALIIAAGNGGAAGSGLGYNAGALSLFGGNGTAGYTGGSVIIDAGSGGSGANVTIGNTYATSVTVSRGGATVSIPGITTFGNVFSVYRGGAVASATSIALTGQIQHITGTVAIKTITAPGSTTNGIYVLIPDGAFTTITGGNIAIASTAVVSKALIMTYDATSALWYPSY